MTGDLVEQLRAALDEHERMTRAATPGPWRRTHPTWPNTSVSGTERLVVASATGHGGSWPSAEDAAHVIASDPTSVLRTIQAHREILERHQPDVVPTDDAYCFGCVCPHRECPAEPPAWPCKIVRSLAFIYVPEEKR